MVGKEITETMRDQSRKERRRLARANRLRAAREEFLEERRRRRRTLRRTLGKRKAKMVKESRRKNRT